MGRAAVVDGRLESENAPVKRRTVEIVVRNWFGRWRRRRGWAGVCVPLPFVSLIFYWGQDPTPGEAAHERCHAAQAELLGAAGFWWHYAIGFLRFGYRNHPMEIQAYRRQEQVEGEA